MSVAADLSPSLPAESALTLVALVVIGVSYYFMWRAHLGLCRLEAKLGEVTRSPAPRLFRCVVLAVVPVAALAVLYVVMT